MQGFRCRYCGAEFATSTERTAHERTHRAGMAVLEGIEPPPTWGMDPWPILRRIRLTDELEDPIPDPHDGCTAIACFCAPPAEPDSCPRCGGDHDRIDRREPCPKPHHHPSIAVRAAYAFGEWPPAEATR